MNEEEEAKELILYLYIAGMTPTASRALANIRSICVEYLDARHSLEVIDLVERPDLAESHQIFAIPTLVRERPLPVRKIIGDLSDTQKVVAGLEIKAA